MNVCMGVNNKHIESGNDDSVFEFMIKKRIIKTCLCTNKYICNNFNLNSS